MGTALLILLAIIIAWFVFKAMSKNTPSGSSSPAALDNPAGSADDPASTASKAAETVTDAAKSAAATAAGAGGAAIAGAAAAAVGGQPAQSTNSDDSGLFPSSGNLVADIAEMFKVLNLRTSDASRLSLSAEQYESLKTGNAAGLSDDVLAGIMQKLKAML